MPDPYLQPNGTLRNKLQISDAAELARFEDQVTTVRQAVLDKRGITGPFGFATLKYIHQFIFQDVYEWAGRPRVCNLTKATFVDASDVSEFTPFTQITSEADRIFQGLADRAEFAALGRDHFVVAVADLFVEINNLHAFREGKGPKTPKAQLCASQGYNFEFSKNGPEKRQRFQCALRGLMHNFGGVSTSYSGTVSLIFQTTSPSAVPPTPGLTRPVSST